MRACWILYFILCTYILTFTCVWLYYYFVLHPCVIMISFCYWNVCIVYILVLHVPHLLVQHSSLSQTSRSHVRTYHLTSSQKTRLKPSLSQKSSHDYILWCSSWLIVWVRFIQAFLNRTHARVKPMHSPRRHVYNLSLSQKSSHGYILWCSSCLIFWVRFIQVSCIALTRTSNRCIFSDDTFITLHYHRRLGAHVHV